MAMVRRHAPSERGAARTSHKPQQPRSRVDRRLNSGSKPHLESSVLQERPNDHHRDDTTTKFRYRCALELKIHFGIYSNPQCLVRKCNS
jgi:hypothetical protein